VNTGARYRLNKLRRKYLSLRVAEIILLSSGFFLLAYSISGIIVRENPILKISFSAGAWLTTFLVQFRYYRLGSFNHNLLTRYLNENFPQLQESADLLLLDDLGLTGLQQIQKLKTLEQFNAVFPSIKPPHHLFRSGAAFAICFLAYLLSTTFSNPGNNRGKTAIHPEIKISVKNDTAVFIRSVSVAISPPTYTGLKSFSENHFDLQFPEGSDVRWEIEFSRPPQNASVLFSGKDSIKFAAAGKGVIQKQVFESGFYQVQWSDKTETHRSDYFKLDVIKDQPPKIEIKTLQQFTKIKYSGLQLVDLGTAISDDYGLANALVVATVSKGSGEGIKFREEKLQFTSPEKVTGKNVVASRFMDLKKLGLDPGDELYFYVEAWDNKKPASNHSRTETFFIAVQDTATEITSVDSGLGIDLMPGYFRSQRQIIIDTEKLLREKKRISKFQFNSTSNELGYDQKVLRLRYGEFLGEEDEAGIGHEEAEQGEEQDVAKQYGHAHDTKNEHNLVDSKRETHEKAIKSPDEKEDPIKAFAHNHDNSEAATFLIQSLKAKLKAAIALMWDAELYLRIYEPEKSLPYQYKALNLLKEISNDSRVYVHRTGFDPPPLKEDKRLTADLSDVKTTTNQFRPRVEKDHPAIRQALNRIEKLIVENTKSISKEDRIALTKAGQELSAEAQEMPLHFLKTLSQVKSLSDQQVREDQIQNVLTQVRKSLWNLLARQPQSPVRHARTSSLLDQAFIHRIEQIRNE